MTDWDPDIEYIGGGVLVSGCELCAIGGPPTHDHYLYGDRWRAVITVELPDQEPPYATDRPEQFPPITGGA